MIASLTGKVKDIFPDFIILDVAGVGYKVEGVRKYFEIGAEIDVYVFTHYTQQGARLFGFLEKDAFLLFQELLIVPGVGPRTAVNLINNLGIDVIKTAIITDNAKTLTGNGVGLKTAQKIILELASKLKKSGYKISNSSLKSEGQMDLIGEVEQALIGLGYNKNEISQVLNKIDLSKISTSEALLREALNKILVRK